MKKTTNIGLALALTVLFASGISCAGAKTGAAAGEALINLMPRTTMGVIALDFHRAMATEGATKALQDPKAKEKYDEFVKMSGIDPMKDISYFGVGLSGDGMNLRDGAVIIEMTYDKAKLLSLVKEKAPEAKEELYEGVTVYSNLDGNGAKQMTRAAFLDENHIVLGSEKGVKGVIDVRMKKAESAAKNAELAAALKKVDKTNLAWGAFLIPQELLQKGIASSPQFKVLEGVKALTLSFDYRLGDFVADIETHGGTKEQNSNLASTLNGFKAMGAMFAGQEPVVGEALGGIEITSGADYTRLAIKLPQETLDKLGKFAQSKAGEFMKKKGS
ncbi:MAG TPA: hypothetical protein VLJ16_12030 [Acidobacteriota bacterium]|nr:hypothetical protein [Acidobacteriota bacterium]